MEIEGFVGSIIEIEGKSDIRFFGVHYGFCSLRYIVVWADVDSNQIEHATDAHREHYKVGMRYDRDTKELLAIWIKGE